MIWQNFQFDGILTVRTGNAGRGRYPQMSLTDAKCRNARPRQGAYKLTDGFGLSLLVSSTGARLWRLDYRMDGKHRTLALGSYPDVTLVAARSARDAARKEIGDGVDPMQERKAAQITAPRRESHDVCPDRRRVIGEA